MTAAYGKHDIDRLEAEVERLKAENADALVLMKKAAARLGVLEIEKARLRRELQMSYPDHCAENDRLRAENARLNALLDTVAGRMEERGASVAELMPELGIIKFVMFGKEK